ncbi:MAG: WYL domain-containing protein [Paludibacteraceae bacterium]|nr:WYL domain-containing protein [Paludibacteraceae bacterium]
MRDLPLHQSQRETEQTDEYSIFELNIRPTFDFQQEILWNGEDVEVLKPMWLRKEIAGKIKRMWNKYNRKLWSQKNQSLWRFYPPKTD